MLEGLKNEWKYFCCVFPCVYVCTVFCNALLEVLCWHWRSRSSKILQVMAAPVDSTWCSMARHQTTQCTVYCSTHLWLVCSVCRAKLGDTRHAAVARRAGDRQVTKKSVCVSAGMFECLWVPSPVLIAHATNSKGIQTEEVGGTTWPWGEERWRGTNSLIFRISK